MGERWGGRFRARRAPVPQAAQNQDPRLQQSFSSVVNDPSKPKDIGEIIWEFVDEQEDEDEEEESTELHGVPVPELPDFEPYLDTFEEVWEAYALNHRVRHRPNSTGQTEDDDACYAQRVVPCEYFEEDFDLGSHHCFEDLRRTVVLQERFDADLSSYMDAVEVSLFKSIQAAQEDNVFDSMVSSSKPLCQDIAQALVVVKNLRNRLRSAQEAHLQSGAVAARLARRKARVAEVLDLLDGFSHMEQLEKSVDALVQGRDYVGALKLLESGSTTLEQEMDVFTSVEIWCSRLARLGRTVALSVQADFVELSTELIFGAGVADEVGLGLLSSEKRSHDTATLKELSWCLVQRRELKSLLGSLLRDKLLFELKKAVRRQVERILEFMCSVDSQDEAAPDAEATEDLRGPAVCSSEQDLITNPAREQSGVDLMNASADLSGVVGAASPSGDTFQEEWTPKDSLDTPVQRKKKSGPRGFLKKVKGKLRSSPSKHSDAGSRTPAASPTAGPNDEAPGQEGFGGATSSTSPTAASRAAATAVSAISSLGDLNVEAFGFFWERTMQFVIDVANRFYAFAECVQGVARSPGEGEEPRGARKPSQPPNAADVLLQLGDDIFEALLQKVSVLLQARQAQHQRLSMPEWRQLIARTSEALDRLGALQRHWSERLGPQEPHDSRKLGADLWAILSTQTKPIIQAFHQHSLAEVQAGLESERWERVDVPGTYSHLLAEIVGTCVDQGLEQPEAADEKATGLDGQELDRCVHFRGLRFLVVPAVLTLIHLLAQYVRLCREWGSCGPQIVWCVAQLLRQFNQQAVRLVMGGQAVHSQTLKKINATHLALCCQCCSLLEALIPCMQEFLLRILEEGCPAARDSILEPVGDLSKTVSEFAAHRTEIFDKLTSILLERYDQHAKRWLGCAHPEVDADFATLQRLGDAQSDVSVYPHAALEGLVKDVVAMYTVLSKSLNPESVQKIFGKAFADIAGKFEQRLASGLAAPYPPYEGMEFRSLGDRLLMDIAFLQEQLGRLNLIDVPLQHLLSDLIYHIRARLPMEDPLRQMHPSTLEALQKSGRIPQ